MEWGHQAGYSGLGCQAEAMWTGPSGKTPWTEAVTMHSGVGPSGQIQWTGPLGKTPWRLRLLLCMVEWGIGPDTVDWATRQRHCGLGIRQDTVD